jgi:hypothetical protein
MALVTYADLLTTVANYLARDDLTAYIPDGVTVFEAAAARRLKVRLQETTATLTPTSWRCDHSFRLSRLSPGDVDGHADP